MNIFKVLLLSLVLTACVSPVNIDFDKNINFNSFSSFSLENKPVRISNDTRIDSPFMQQRIVKELTRQFTKKGYKNLKLKPDLKIKYYLDIKHEIETQDSGGVAFGLGTASHHSALGIGFNIPIGEATSVDLLVLTIDVISAKTNNLLWRGSLDSYLYDGATPATYNKLVEGLVSEILENFPPK